MPRGGTGQYRTRQPGDPAGDRCDPGGKAPGGGKGIGGDAEGQAEKRKKGKEHHPVDKGEDEKVGKDAVRREITEGEGGNGQGTQLRRQRNAGGLPQEAAGTAAPGGRPQAGKEQYPQGGAAGEQKTEVPHGGGIEEQQNDDGKAQSGQAIPAAAPQRRPEGKCGHPCGTQHAGGKPGKGHHDKAAARRKDGTAATAPQEGIPQTGAGPQQDGEVQTRNGQQVADPGGGEGGAQRGGEVGGFGGEHGGDEGGGRVLPERAQGEDGLAAQPQKRPQGGGAVGGGGGQCTGGKRHPAGKQEGFAVDFCTGDGKGTGNGLPGKRGVLLREGGGEMQHTVLPRDPCIDGAAVGGIGADREDRSRKGEGTAGELPGGIQAQGVDAADQRGGHEPAEQRPPQGTQRADKAEGKAAEQQDAKRRAAPTQKEHQAGGERRRTPCEIPPNDHQAAPHL